jgi:hypothetical protein
MERDFEMPKKLLPTGLAAVLLFGAAHGGSQLSPEVRVRAEKVQAALRAIEREQGRADAGQSSQTFTEAEFNAWIAYRLEEEREPYVKAVELKLLAEDRVEGRILLDLGKSQAGGLLSERQELYFSAGFETREGRIRIDMDSLYLGTQKIAPSVIDFIIGVVSRLQGAEPTSLRDWYELPPGVLGLRTRPGRLVVVH